MHDRQKQVKYQVFYPLILEKKPYLRSRIWLQSTQTLLLHDAPRHASSFQLTAAPLFPTDQAEEFPSTDTSHLTPTPCCRLYWLGFGFVFRKPVILHSAALVVFQHAHPALRGVCVCVTFTPEALTTKGPILKSHVNGSLPEAFVHTVSRMLNCRSSL